MQEKSFPIARCFDYVLAVLFLTVICAPLSVQLMGLEPGLSNDEKRELAQLPGTPASFEEVLGFPEAFNAYADDGFGLRKMFLRLGSRLRWMLGWNVTSRVLFGKDGWLYLGEHDNIIEQFRGIDLFSRDELLIWVQTMICRRDWLLEKGIPFILVVAPNKHSIYPEYLPKRVGNGSGLTPLDQLSEYIAAYTDLDFIDLRKPVMVAKKEDLVFYKTDSHWNELGAFTGYLTLMEHVKKYFPHVESLQWNQFFLEERVVRTGDLAGMANMKGQLTETSNFLIPKFKSRILQQEMTGLDDNARCWDIRSNLEANPDVLIFSDSFIKGMLKYVGESFHRTIAVPHNGLIFDTVLIDAEKPDLVIYELVERVVRAEISDNRTLLNKFKPPFLNDFLSSPETQLKKIRFGDTFALVAVKMTDSRNGCKLQLVWKSLTKQPLLYSNAIHLVNRDGKILSGFDYPQNKGKVIVNPGDTWLDQVDIPHLKMKDASAIAIGIYTNEKGLLAIDSGPRDWDGKRLVIPLPLKPEP